MNVRPKVPHTIVQTISTMIGKDNTIKYPSSYQKQKIIKNKQKAQPT